MEEHPPGKRAPGMLGKEDETEILQEQPFPEGCKEPEWLHRRPEPGACPQVQSVEGTEIFHPLRTANNDPGTPGQGDRLPHAGAMEPRYYLFGVRRKIGLVEVEGVATIDSRPLPQRPADLQRPDTPLPPEGAQSIEQRGEMAFTQEKGSAMIAERKRYQPASPQLPGNLHHRQAGGKAPIISPYPDHRRRKAITIRQQANPGRMMKDGSGRMRPDQIPPERIVRRYERCSIFD